MASMARNADMQKNMQKNMNNKNILQAIIFCRLSRVADPERGVLSLDSQEHAIRQYLEECRIGVFAVLRSVGSAYKTPQTDLKNMLKSCKGKVLVVFEPNRLSRNLRNFAEIWNICRRNKHVIRILNRNETYSPQRAGDHDILRALIRQAQQEMIDMGARISRTWSYKRSKMPAWGNMVVNGAHVANPEEISKTNLITLLSTPGSSIATITTLVNQLGVTEGKGPFEIVDERGRDVRGRMPDAMSPAKIAETLKYYVIKKRGAFFKSSDIKDILESRPVVNNTVDVDDLVNDFVVLNPREEERRQVPVVENVSSPIAAYEYVMFDPAIGLPPNVRLPEGVPLPTIACMMYLPRRC
jgi:DNA invertase Pin-like site-specific DNA recombinase